MVLFVVEKKAPKQDPTTAQVIAAITKLRSYGPSSFASLTDAHGNYLQVAGGGLTCLLERRTAAGAQHFRAYLEKPSGIHPDGTTLAFSGGQVKLRADEWISAPLVIDAFTAFLQGHELPQTIRWRDITTLLGS
ncbi:hypothetical protein EWM63_02960 [Pseudoduganella lutea]|uniref:Uncharacterized protein n=1 Tax=Pseudoduganella lutea TaxID=321985 RepID=A0A4P6KT50_9BURK|nr:hypothetical protein EWM63_02960 [Pseudoduganella lutea]